VKYEYLVDTYETERLKVMSVWSLFKDEDLRERPHAENRRGRSVLEQMVHQCASEDLWFRGILGIDVSAPPLPALETRREFIRRYALDSGKRLQALRSKDDSWWEDEAPFFDVRCSRAWVLVRRMDHTAHHRGQQTAMLRMLHRDLHSTYGPTADTGGLMQHNAPTIYAYPDEDALLTDADTGANRTPLPGPGDKPPRNDRSRGRPAHARSKTDDESAANRCVSLRWPPCRSWGLPRPQQVRQ